MNSTPHIETQEIADADLDNLSGAGIGDVVDVNVNAPIAPAVNTSAVTGLVSNL